MINKIGIENFRVFNEFTEFEIRPITTLTGPNNSGKSSFLKLLNLLQNSYGAWGSLNVLKFDSGTHNLGTYKNTINWENDSNEIKIILDFSLDYFDEKFKLELTYHQLKENGLLKSFRIFNEKRTLFNLYNIEKFSESEFVNKTQFGVDFKYSLDLEYLKYTIKQHTICNDSKNYSKELNEKYKKYKSKWTKIHIKDGYDAFQVATYNKFNEGTPGIHFPFQLKDFAKKYQSQEFLKLANQDYLFFNYLINDLNADEKYYDRLSELENEYLKEHHSQDSNLGINIKADYFTELFENSASSLNLLVEYYNKHLSSINEIFEAKFNEDRVNIFEKFIIDNINLGINKIKFSFKNINFISAFRGNKNRVLSNESSNEIDEIIKEFAKLDFNSSEHKINSKFLNRSLEILKIKGEIVIERMQGTASIVYFKHGNRRVSLSDLGFGYSQVIPIILKIILLMNNLDWINEFYVNRHNPFRNAQDKSLIYPIFIIEEPEANLHPDLQSKFAEILIMAYKFFGIHFILETHSEYLIRKLQYLTAKKRIESHDVNIYYFNSDEYVNNKVLKVKKIMINEYGGLTDNFGPGFFDESTNLQFDLLKLNKVQNN